MADLTRFNEAIDQALSESVGYYTKAIVQSKDLFVGILTHDLRNPVQAIMSSTELSLNMGSLSERQTMLANNTYECASRVNALIDSLLDVTRARLGAGLPIVRSPMDIGFVANQVVDEIRMVHPTCIIALDVSGDTEGKLDKARIGQVFSNLLSNAIQYSFKSSPIEVSVEGGVDAVVLKFHNDGVPIASDKIKSIFDPLTRLVSNNKDQPTSPNLGLGLYITKEIVVAHDGTIEVKSSEKSGTTFTIRLPRLKPAPVLHVA